MKKYLLISLFALSFSSVLSADTWMSSTEKTTPSTNLVNPVLGKNAHQDQFKTASDKATNQRIREHLAKNIPQILDTIMLRTSEGVVVIDGVVDTQENQKKMNHELEQVNGVKHLVNNTQIKMS